MTEMNPPPTRLDGPHQPAPDSPPATRLDAPATPAAAAPEFRRENLPPGLAARMRMGAELGSGAEASVWHCRDANDNEFAVKLFRRPPHYAGELGSAEYQEHFRPEYAVQVFERAVDHGVHYEVMEYCRFGTLDAMLARNNGFGGNSGAIDILWQLATALHGMQRAGGSRVLVHGDIKPKNILVRTENPLDLVLADFGLTVDLDGRSKLTNLGAGTAAFSAPDAPQYFSPEADWWSVGMVMFAVLVGRGYFQREDGGWIDDHTVRHQLTIRDVSVAAIDAVPVSAEHRGRWKLLLAGLLTKDPQLRWGMSQVSQWRDGAEPAVHRSLADGRDDAAAPRRRAASPFPLPGVGQFFRAEELGAAMAAHPDAAARSLAGRGLQRLLTWLTREVGCTATFTDLRSHGADWGPDELTAYFVSQLAPGGPAVYRGRPVGTRAELRALALDETAATDAAELFTANLLGCLAAPDRPDHKLIDADWHDIAAHALTMADTRGIDLDPPARAQVIRFALLLAVSDGTFTNDYLTTVVRKLASPELAMAGNTGWFTALRADAERAASTTDSGRSNSTRAMLVLLHASAGPACAEAERAREQQRAFATERDVAAADRRRRDLADRDERRRRNATRLRGADATAMVLAAALAITVLVPYLIGHFLMRKTPLMTPDRGVFDGAVRSLGGYFPADYLAGLAALVAGTALFLLVRPWHHRLRSVVIGWVLVLALFTFVLPKTSSSWHNAEQTSARKLATTAFPFRSRYYTCDSYDYSIKWTDGRTEDWQIYLTQEVGFTGGCNRVDVYNGWSKVGEFTLDGDVFVPGTWANTDISHGGFFLATIQVSVRSSRHGTLRFTLDGAQHNQFLLQ